MKSKPTQKLKQANSIPECFEYFQQMSSKSILIILSYSVSKFPHFLRHSVLVLKADIALHGNPILELRDVTCHMRSHSVTCHPTQVNAPWLVLPCRLVLDLPTPWGMEGWVDLVDLIAPRPGVEPATFRSGVRRRTAAPRLLRQQQQQQQLQLQLLLLLLLQIPWQQWQTWRLDTQSCKSQHRERPTTVETDTSAYVHINT